MTKAAQTKSPSAVFWGVYKLTPEGLDLLHGTGLARGSHPNGGAAGQSAALMGRLIPIYGSW
jgi:hypothetical protein